MFARGLIIEDLPEAQVWLQASMRSAFPGIKLTTVSTFADASRAIHNEAVEVALVDLNLPDGFGIDLVALARRIRPAMRTVVTTVYDDDAHIFPALRAGARGYLLKDGRQEDLARQLQSLMHDELPLSPAIVRSVLKYFSQSSFAEPLPHEALTAKERDVLVSLANGYTLQEIAQHLQISRNTVATHVKRIYAKLNISNRSEAVRAAQQIGLLARS